MFDPGPVPSWPTREDASVAKQLERKSGYNYLFWCQSMTVALTIWVLTRFTPDFAYLASDALLSAVMVGWLNAIWSGSRTSAAPQVKPEEIFPPPPPTPSLNRMRQS